MIRKPSIGRAVGFALLAQALAAQAAQPEEATDDGGVAARRQATGDSTGRASLQLFEFLGEFTTEDGEWVDPEVLLEADLVSPRQGEMGTRGGDGEATVPDESCRDAHCE